MSPSSVRSGGVVRAAVGHDVEPRAVHLRRHGDPAHRDPLGLQAQEGRLLSQPLPPSAGHQQGTAIALCQLRIGTL